MLFLWYLYCLILSVLLLFKNPWCSSCPCWYFTVISDVNCVPDIVGLTECCCRLHYFCKHPCYARIPTMLAVLLLSFLLLLAFLLLWAVMILLSSMQLLIAGVTYVACIPAPESFYFMMFSLLLAFMLLWRPWWCWGFCCGFHPCCCCCWGTVTLSHTSNWKYRLCELLSFVGIPKCVTLEHSNKIQKLNFSVTFLLVTFLTWVFCNFFNGFKISIDDKEKGKRDEAAVKNQNFFL